MTSFTSDRERKLASYLPKRPRTSFPYYVIMKPRQMPCFYLGKWESKLDTFIDFLTADSIEELWIWLDAHGIYRQYVFDATSVNGELEWYKILLRMKGCVL